MDHKKTGKSVFTVLLPVTVLILNMIVLFSALSEYEARGDILLVETADYAAAKDSLEHRNIPFSTEVMVYRDSDCFCIRSRIVLMPVIEEILRENTPIPVYREVHRALFLSVVFSFSLSAALCLIYGIRSKNRIGKCFFPSAAFVILIGGMKWLSVLPLTL